MALRSIAVLLLAAASQVVSAGVYNECQAGQGYSAFTRDQALRAIDGFCSSQFPNVGNSYVDNLVFQFNVGWRAGRDASEGINLATKDCPSIADASQQSVSADDCKTNLQAAVDNCDTNSTSTKYGNIMTVVRRAAAARTGTFGLQRRVARRRSLDLACLSNEKGDCVFGDQ